MSRKKLVFIIVTLFALTLVVPFLMGLFPRQPKTHLIDLQAQKYQFTPSRIIVNKGDTIIIRPTSLDVTHGFFLDGYDLEFTIKQEGLALLKYTWEEDDGTQKTDWDKVREIEFVAQKTGKFTYRCFQICGNLHPFMTGELIVNPNGYYYLAISLSVWVLLSSLLWLKFTGEALPRKRPRLDLLRQFPWLMRLVKTRGFHFVLLLPNVVIFYLFILSALWGSPVGNRNIAIIFVWIFWWFALKAIFVPLGARLWCTICPLPAPAEWLSRMTLTGVRYFNKQFKGIHHKYLGLQKDWPRVFRNMWLQNVIFMVMISFGIILITRPVATAMLFLTILAATLVLALVYRRRVFCMYLCPVGGFLGNYSMASVTEVRCIDPDVCRNHKEKSCLIGSKEGWGCPWNQYMGNMDRNNYCNYCMECVKSCPKDNIGVFTRPFGSDTKIKGFDEMYNIFIMLVVAIAFSITMLGPWGFIKNAANVTESGNIPHFLAYLVVLWSASLVVVPGIFIIVARLSNRWVGSPVHYRDLTRQLSTIFIPVGIFAWIAFSLPSVMVNYNYILAVLSDPLGLGWDILGTADYAFQPFIPEWIPVIQGILLLTGLFLGIRHSFRAVTQLIVDRTARFKTIILPSLFAWMIINFLLKLYMG